MKIQEKRVIVTAASAGNGYKTGKLFVLKGAQVAAVGGGPIGWRR